MEAYRCDSTYTLGINTQYFHRFLKNVSGHELLEINYDETDPDNLSMAIRNPETGSRRVKMRLLHLEDGDLAGMPDADYSMILTMPSNDLQRIIREMLPNGETVRITCSKVNGERQVTFTTSGEAGDIACDLNLEMDRMEVEQFEDIDMLVRDSLLYFLQASHPLTSAPRTMEYDLIYELLAENPFWLTPFPIVLGVEYYVDYSAKHLGRGDLLVCSDDYSHYLVVEVKESLRSGRKGKLLEQMDRYRDHTKWRHPYARVDCAAVQGGKLIKYKFDNGLKDSQMFFTPAFQEAWMKHPLTKKVWLRAVLAQVPVEFRARVAALPASQIIFKTELPDFTEV